jgi:purine-binding chemotaxis protein CheW
MSRVAAQSRGAIGTGRRDLQFVTFVLCEKEYAVAVADVHGIYHGLPLIPSSDSVPFMEGEVQLVDQRVSVLSLRRFAGLSDVSDVRQPGWIVVVNHAGHPLGVAVDRVTEVLQLTPQNLEPPTGAESTPVADYIVAVVRLNGRAIFLPDFSRLLHDAIP